MLEINLASLDALVRAKSLRFPKDLEGLYREAHFRDALLVNRLCVIAGSLLLASFGILDEAMFPHSYHLVWTIRFGLLVPLAILLTLVSFSKGYERWMQSATALLMIAVLVGILSMIAVSGPHELGATLYLFGLLPVVSFLFAATRLFFLPALGVALLTLAVFEWVLFRHNGLIASGSLEPEIAIAANFFIISEISIGALASFFFERSGRTRFIQELIIAQERLRSDDLVYNMLPAAIAERLKRKELIADKIEGASVLFADLVNFTRLSATLAPSDVLVMLDQCFTCFDRITEKYGAEKIKTIGDSYMVAVGVPQGRPDHAIVMGKMALELRDAFYQLPTVRQQNLGLRLGFSSGPMVAGVVGSNKRIYDLWGDTVNTASRMESNGVPGEIQLSHYAHSLMPDAFVYEPRGEITIKGKGQMRVYLLKGLPEVTESSPQTSGAFAPI
jgi:class 3 adenylate cyclase